jgi:hypothetical protein
MNLNGVKNKNIEENFPLWAGAVALILLVFLFKKFKESSARKRSQYTDEITPEDEFHNWTANNS